MIALRWFAFAGATGAIFYVYGESMFWSIWRPNIKFVEGLASWGLYSVAAGICLLLIRQNRVRSLAPMVMIGAVLGWLVEGVFAMTFFGIGDMPFPITIVWTGLAWHALFSVLVGWYGMQLALRRSFLHSLLVSAGLGLFWGVWALSWAAAKSVTWQAFLLNALGSSLLLALAFRAGPWLDVAALPPSQVAAGVLGTILLAWFGAVTVPHFGLLTLLLALLLGIALWALWVSRLRDQGADFVAILGEPVPWRRSLAFLAIPVVASLVREAGSAAAGSSVINTVVLFVTVPVSAIGFVVSLWSLLRPVVPSGRAQAP
jgi:hypothetical protein